MKTVTFHELNNKAMEIYDRAFNTLTGLAAKGMFEERNEMKTFYCEEIVRMAYFYIDEACHELPRSLAMTMEEHIHDLKWTMKNTVSDSYKSPVATKRKSLFV